MSTNKPTKIQKEHYLEWKGRLVGSRPWEVQFKTGLKSSTRKPPRPLEGIIEESLVYDPNSYPRFGLLHTSWLPVEDKWRNTGRDSIWPLIVEKGEVVYYGDPCDRTVEGLIEAYTYALIIEHEVDNFPMCRLCDRMMPLERIVGTKDYRYICRCNKDHPMETVILEFGFSLPQGLKDFLAGKKAATDHYNERNAKNNIFPTPAGVKRKKWIVIEPNSSVK